MNREAPVLKFDYRLRNDYCKPIIDYRFKPIIDLSASASRVGHYDAIQMLYYYYYYYGKNSITTPLSKSQKSFPFRSFVPGPHSLTPLSLNFAACDVHNAS